MTPTPPRRTSVGPTLIGLLVLTAAGFSVIVFALTAGRNERTEPVVAESPDRVYDPVRAGEELPRGYRPLLVRDRIRPIYQPEFVRSSDVDWPDDMLVIGVAGEREAKAYPVTHLNQREMVNDELEGSPILVTW